jgi:hypothetical protein
MQIPTPATAEAAAAATEEEVEKGPKQPFSFPLFLVFLNKDNGSSGSKSSLSFLPSPYICPLARSFGKDYWLYTKRNRRGERAAFLPCGKGAREQQQQQKAIYKGGGGEEAAAQRSGPG